MLAYCSNCWTIELPWLDCEFSADDDGVAEEDDDEEEAEEGRVTKPEAVEVPGNEIDMTSPQSAAQIKQRACQTAEEEKACVFSTN
jgi:hypothetical protein